MCFSNTCTSTYLNDNFKIEDNDSIKNNSRKQFPLSRKPCLWTQAAFHLLAGRKNLHSVHGKNVSVYMFRQRENTDPVVGIKERVNEGHFLVVSMTVLSYTHSHPTQEKSPTKSKANPFLRTNLLVC